MKTDRFNLEFHKNIIQSSNLNFLIGSGLSQPYISTLGNIENIIEILSQRDDVTPLTKNYLSASLLCHYFTQVMYPNINVLNDSMITADKEKTLNNYVVFLQLINELIHKRYSTIINKQANIFTTNIDLFFEKAIEKVQMEFNDGFSGRITPVFSLSNYNKVISKCSHSFDNESRIPIINLYKLHGSLNWRYSEDKKFIRCSFNTQLLEDIKKKIDSSKLMKN